MNTIAFLTKLADLIDEHRAEIYYTNEDDGVHIDCDGVEVFVGSIDGSIIDKSISASRMLREAARVALDDESQA